MQTLIVFEHNYRRMIELYPGCDRDEIVFELIRWLNRRLLRQRHDPVWGWFLAASSVCCRERLSTSSVAAFFVCSCDVED